MLKSTILILGGFFLGLATRKFVLGRSTEVEFDPEFFASIIENMLSTSFLENLNDHE